MVPVVAPVLSALDVLAPSPAQIHFTNEEIWLIEVPCNQEPSLRKLALDFILNYYPTLPLTYTSEAA